MARTKSNMKTLQKRREAVKEAVVNVHDAVLRNTEELVEASIKTGAKWQKLMEKAVKNSEPLMSKQVDMVFDTLEGVKDQLTYGRTRVSNLLGIDTDELKKSSQEVVTRTRKAVQKVVRKAGATELADKLDMPKAEVKPARVKTAVKRAKVAGRRAKVAVNETKAAVRETKAAVKEATSAVKVNVTEGKNDLKTIDGIGPKMETVLNQAGIMTFADLAKTSMDDLKKILLDADKRYRLMDPAPWKVEAEKLAAKS